MSELKKYLTIHGHFYQPPRENPWLEEIELQESALPYHDWNARVCAECYSPNSISKIVGDGNKILDIVNNYAHMSFNMGPTLLSWMEKYEPDTYKRIIDADIKSVEEFSGHGNALAQVYNHIIMPLANEKDKYTQVLWGGEDFKRRYGRMPEGIWLAETACDDETLGVLADCGIKFTVLSPYQAEKVIKNGEMIDVSDGTIDSTQAYRYNIKCRENKYIDLFFYNAQISQAVAFEELLKDGGRFVEKIKTGISKEEDFPRLVNIATDGESYGHHTKFGDMALAYVLRIKSYDEGFTLTNYGEYLEKFPPKNEVIIKPVSSWSCCHGVGRWKEDCGCSTGGMQGWNQKWRKPLREALDNLRDKLSKITESVGKNLFKDVWAARNDYINVILNRNEETVHLFLEKNAKENLSEQDKINAVKLMEIQRQAMLMYTSCGWFFNELSGIETVQILKYAARAIQLAGNFSDEDLESDFLDILQDAKSNIPGYGNGRDIWNNFVKPCVMNFRQIASLWAITSLYENYDKITDLYCYSIKKFNTKKVSKGNSNLITGHIEIKSKVTFETADIMFALLQYSGGDFHCAIRGFHSAEKYMQIVKNLNNAFLSYPPTETIRLLDEYFGREYFTLKDILIEQRRKILKSLLKKKIDKFQSVYREVYNDGKGSVLHFKNLGLEVPAEYKIAAKYTLSSDFNEIFKQGNCLQDENALQNAADIINEAKSVQVELDKIETAEFFSKEIEKRIQTFTQQFTEESLSSALEIFKIKDSLELNPNVTKAQNAYFTEIYTKFSLIIQKVLINKNIADKKEFMINILKLGEKLNINTDFYKNAIVKAAGGVTV